jgi:transcriptional regulator with XRE-family HTH domain
LRGVKKNAAKTSHKANVAFGDALRQLRTRAGMSQERLAELAGVHRNHVGDIERGDKEACLLTMLRISKALQVPLSAVMLEMEGPARKPQSRPAGKRT